MTDWKKIIIGDAAKLPSNNPRYYLDIALTPIVIISGIWLAIEIGSGRPATGNPNEVRIIAVVFFGSLLLASERLVLLAVGFGYVALQSLTMGSVHSCEDKLPTACSSVRRLSISRNRRRYSTN